MSEKNVIEQSKLPVTLDLIYKGLVNLGVKRGDVLLTHTSLSSFGWICGGPQSLIMALFKAVGENGTLVMPAHSGDWSDPINWQNPPVPNEWVPIIRENMPAFDQHMTPTRQLGRVAELFRTLPGTIRSNHPLLSFSAKGRMAFEITDNHPLVPQMGIDSPLGSLYGLGAKVLLLGVGYDSCTSFHLAETFMDNMPKIKSGTAIQKNGERRWVSFEDINYDSNDFEKLGADFENTNPVSIEKIGNAECRLFDMKAAVDFAKTWFSKNRLKNSADCP